MAVIITYNSLVTTIQQYMERQDARFLESIPTFILLGQRRVCNDLKILQIKNFIKGNLQTGVNTLQKPVDWLNTTYFFIGTGPSFGTQTYLQERAIGYLPVYWPNITQTAQPKYVADYTYSYWQFAPTPDQDYPFECGYYQLPPLLDTNNQTNILTMTIPHVLLYSCLLETASWLKDDERIAVWTSYYNTARESVANEDMSRIYDGFSQRNL